jgi:hypothetical protein
MTVRFLGFTKTAKCEANQIHSKKQPLPFALSNVFTNIINTIGIITGTRRNYKHINVTYQTGGNTSHVKKQNSLTEEAINKPTMHDNFYRCNLGSNFRNRSSSALSLDVSPNNHMQKIKVNQFSKRVPRSQY